MYFDFDSVLLCFSWIFLFYVMMPPRGCHYRIDLHRYNMVYKQVCNAMMLAPLLGITWYLISLFCRHKFAHFSHYIFSRNGCTCATRRDESTNFYRKSVNFMIATHPLPTTKMYHNKFFYRPLVTYWIRWTERSRHHHTRIDDRKLIERKYFLLDLAANFMRKTSLCRLRWICFSITKLPVSC